jgi:hypothetical protein
MIGVVSPSGTPGHADVVLSDGREIRDLTVWQLRCLSALGWELKSARPRGYEMLGAEAGRSDRLRGRTGRFGRSS